MRYCEIIKSIEEVARIERVKQWRNGGEIYITVACLTPTFEKLSKEFNNIVPDDRQPNEKIMICRRC